MRNLNGVVLAAGEEVDTVRGGQVTSRLTFHFRDSSLDDETTVFTQHSQLQLISDHHVQRGPSFPHPIDMTVDARSGTVRIRSGEGDKEKVTMEHMDLPPDVSNGLITDVIRNLMPDAPETKLSDTEVFNVLCCFSIIVVEAGEKWEARALCGIPKTWWESQVLGLFPPVDLHANGSLRILNATKSEGSRSIGTWR